MNAAHPQLLLQTSVYDTIKDDATIQSLLGGENVFDFVPDNQDLPFVTIGDDQYNDWSSYSHDGFQGEIRIHTWAEARGRSDCKSIQNRIYALLHGTDLSLSGFPTISLRCTLTHATIDPDRRTAHGMQTFSFILDGN